MLLSFNNTDGESPATPLISDSAGNLFGTAGGGKHGKVYELSPPSGGNTTWIETVLLSFKKSNGGVPFSGLISDDAGNLFGGAQGGGAHGYGAVYELSPPSNGKKTWTETVLFSFDKTNGDNDVQGPTATLIADGAGNFYGTTQGGGVNGDGVVFELSPPVAGQTAWTETVLQSFDGTNGKLPQAGLLADGAGNIYGTTNEGGPIAKASHSSSRLSNISMALMAYPDTGKPSVFPKRLKVSAVSTNGTDLVDKI